MQELKLPEESFLQIYAGDKRATIRSGHREIVAGSLVLESTEGGWGVVVKVTDVQHKTLGDITDTEATLNAFENVQALVDDLKTVYPNVQLTDDITLVAFDFFDPFEWTESGEVI